MNACTYPSHHVAVPKITCATSVPMQIRAPWQNISGLVNDVAASIGIGTELVSGGSGRSYSSTDYVVRMGPLPQSQRQIKSRLEASKEVSGSIEMKGFSQWPLEMGEDLVSMTEEQRRERKLSSAMEQCYGDMVMDEAPVGAISRHEVTVLLQRSGDAPDSTLQVSPAIGLDQLLLALLVLLDQAEKLAHLKPGLARGKFPKLQMAQRGPARLQQLPAEQGSPQQPQALGEATRQSSSDPDSSNSGSPPTGVEEEAHEHEAEGGNLGRFSFGEVGLTGRCAGDSQFGPVLEVR